MQSTPGSSAASSIFTAQALELELPTSILLRADEVIE